MKLSEEFVSMNYVIYKYFIQNYQNIYFILGRIVITHSTYIEGLIPVLKRLASNENIKTVTPASISKVRGRATNLTIRISVSTISGYKAIARKGQSAQEVFITTEMSKKDLECLIRNYCKKQKN